MKQWEIWKFPYPSADRAHWFVVISASGWSENPGNVAINGLLCTTLRPAGRTLRSHEVRLDAADGMDGDTGGQMFAYSRITESPGNGTTGTSGRSTSKGDRPHVARLLGFGLT